MSINYSSTAFKFIGGILCLDFINTVEGRSSNSHQRGATGDQYKIIGEKLRSYLDLVTWSRHEKAGSLSPKDARRLIELAEKHPRLAQAVFENGIRLREALYRIFKSAANGRRPSQADLEKLNDELKNARAHEQLIFSAETFGTEWENMSDALDSPLWPVARSAAD